MKLADRTFMNETRYTQSFGDFTHRKNKLLSTGFTNNTMNTTMRLPKLSRSVSSSTTKSAKNRLDIIEQQVQNLKTNVNDLKMDTRESRRFVNFLKDDLVERQLNQHKNILALQIKKLDNMFKFNRKQNQDRTKTIKFDCQQLANSSKSIINMVEALRVRLDNLQDAMGVYSAKEKHKF